MAEGAVIGALRVVLGADTVQFEQALKKGSSALDGFAKQFGKIGAGIAAGMGAATAALGAGLKSAIDHADKLNKASQKIGVPVEELSALTHAASLADVEMEALTASMGKLAKNMTAVAGGAQNDAAKAFTALGISVKNTDGSLKSSSEVMAELAGSFAGLEDGAAKTALAIAIFGKAGAQMIPLLNAGRKGLEESTEEAKRFGLVVSTQTAQSAEKFNDNLKRLGSIMQGIFLKVAAESVDALEDLSDAMVKTAGSAESIETTASVVSGAMRGLAAIAIGTGGAFAQMARDWKLVVEVGKNITSLEGIKTAFNDWQAASKAANAENNETVARLLGLSTSFRDTDNAIDSVVKTMQRYHELAGKKPAPILESKTALDSFIDSTKKSIAAQQAEVQTFGMSEGARARQKLLLEAEAIAIANNTTLRGKQKDMINALSLEVESLTNKIQGQQLIAEVLPIWDQYNMALEKAQQSIAGLNPTLEQTAAVNQKVAEKFGLTWQQQSASIAGSMGDIVDTFAGENKKMIAVGKTLHAAQALIATYAGASEALALPFPSNLAASAAVLAKGLAFVAAINNVGFATGGSFKVGGGMTGIDSEMVAFKATPGEMVDVRRPGQDGGSSWAPQEINIGMRIGDFITGTNLRDLIHALNAGNRDGYRLKFAER